MNVHRLGRLRRRLEGEIERLTDSVGIPERDRPGFDNLDGARPFISIGADGSLVYLAYERGELLFSRSTRQLSELLYWAVSDTVGQQGQSWEQQASMLHALDPSWAEKWCAELAAMLPPDRVAEVPSLPPTPFTLKRPTPRKRAPQNRKPAVATSWSNLAPERSTLADVVRRHIDQPPPAG